jgi:hypothetical protein
MKPFASRLTVPVYFVSAIFIIWGISLNFTQTLDQGSFKFIFPVGYFFTVIFMVLAIREVLGSGYISKNERWMWMIGLILLNLVAGMVYVIVGRTKVLGIQDED